MKLPILLLLLASLTFAGIPYWIESNNGTIPANAYLAIKINLTSGVPYTPYIYYGGAINRSNGTGVFEYYDDFANGAYPDASLWQTQCGEGARIIGNALVVYNATDNTCNVSSKIGFDVNKRVIINGKFESMAAATHDGFFMFDNSTKGPNWYLRHGLNFQGPAGPYTYDIRQRNITGIAAGASQAYTPGFNEYEIVRNSTAIVNYILDHAIFDSLNTYMPLDYLNFSMFASIGSRATIDYVAIGNYSYPEPTAVYGAEELGTWSIDGDTFTKRKPVTIVSSNTIYNYPTLLSYAQIGDSEIYITTNANPGVPSVYLNTPTNNSNYQLPDTNITFNYSAFVMGNTAYSLKVNGSVYFTDTATSDTTLQHSIKFNQSGYYGVEINYSNGSYSNTSGIFTLRVVPNVVLDSPANNSFASNDVINFQFSLYSANITTLQLFVNNSLIYSGISNGSASFTVPYTVTQGFYSWYVNYSENTGFSNQSYTYIVGRFNSEDYFSEFLNATLSPCTDAEKTELLKCSEWYKLTKIYDFRATACHGMNSAIPITCLSSQGVGNFSNKNNWTIFYAPSTWQYAPNLTGVEHTGALYSYLGYAINPGFALINKSYFVFFPAQDRDRDCSIKYSSVCSYFNGFIINNKQVIVSDRDSNFYSSNGIGVDNYNESYYGNIVIESQLLPLDFYASRVFPTGFYTKKSCIANGGNYAVSIYNTESKQYRIIWNGENGSSYSFTGQALNYIVPLQSDTSLNVTANDEVICSYSSSGKMFLGTDISFLNSNVILQTVMQGFSIVLMALSVISPLFLIGFVSMSESLGLLSFTQIAAATGLAMIGTLIINTTSYERGYKNALMLLFIFLGYVLTLGNVVDTSVIFNGAVQQDIADLISLQNDFTAFGNANNIASMAFEAINIVVSIFVLIVKLPAIIVALIFDLLLLVSPVLYSTLYIFKQMLQIGFTMYVYLRAYEVIRNVYRGI